jgi:2-oxoisovalerate dehydrogenase E2 component (dihydrolipoyl transacylase)
MIDFILPDIGEGIVECELLEWLVKEGEVIVEDQPVAEVMTDKATVQIPAMHSGVVNKLYYKAGEVAKVHSPLFAMTVEGEVVSEPLAAKAPDGSDNQSNTQSESNSVFEDFILPDIGEGIVECELVKWLVNEGDLIEEDQAVVEVMTDKALVEIPAKYSGKVSKLYYAQGNIAKVHTPLFAMELQAKTVNEVSNSTVVASGTSATIQQSNGTTDSAVKAQSPVAKGKALASPAVRRLAREMDIEISEVAGSGNKGRVMKQDLVAHTQEQQHAPKSAPNAIAAQNNAQIMPLNTTSGGTRTEVIRGIKAAMAKQMMLSVSTIPHFTVSEEIEMDSLIEVRKLLKPKFEKQGVKLSFMPFFIKALSLALKEFPIINAQVNDDCTELTYFDDHNIGMAVDSKIGLMVPNIKGVQNLSLFEVAQQGNQIVEQARDGKLKSADLKGGTISISNIGVLGGTVATPVINKPEAAIVALGKMQRLPRFDEYDNVKAVNIMHVSWSGDHRIIDGATMVRFNNLWKSYLENPVTMLAELK